MPKLIDVCTVRTKDHRTVEGDRKQVAATVEAAVKGKKPRPVH